MADTMGHSRHRSTMAVALARLTEREMVMFQEETDARTRVAEAMNKTTYVCSELQQLRRSQEIEFKVLKTSLDKKSRDNAYRLRKQIHTVQKELTDLIAEAEAAKNRRSRAEAHKKALEAKVAELESGLSQRLRDQHDQMTGLDSMLKTRMDQITKQNQSRARDMSEHCSRRCEASAAAVQAAGDTLQDQFVQANVRSEARTRFFELWDLSKRREDYDMPKDAYFEAKNHLVSLWHSQVNAPALPKTGNAAGDDQRTSALGVVGRLKMSPTQLSPSLESTIDSPSALHAITSSVVERPSGSSG